MLQNEFTPTSDMRASSAYRRAMRGQLLRRGGQLSQPALAAARHRLQGRFAIGGQEHFYLKGQVALAVPRAQDQWHIHSSAQHTGEVQR